MRGYFGIGIAAGKTPENLGGLWRSAHAFGAACLFTIGARYPRRTAADTTDAAKHVPLFEFDDWQDFEDCSPPRATVVGVEIGDDAVSLPIFEHPERALYVLGAEDTGLPDDVRDGCDWIVSIPSTYCLNVATAGSIVLYDRIAKAV